MNTSLIRTAGLLPALPVLLVLGACGVAAGMPGSAFPSSVLTALVWLLGAGGGFCLLLRRGIDLDDRARELAARLCLEQKARQLAEGSLLDSQAALTRLVRQQEGVRDSERKRIARDIDDELGQVLVSLRAEMSLLQVASAGIHPATHQKTSAMIVTVDLALRSLRVLAGELRPLAAGERLGGAVTRQLAEFTRLNGIAHRLDLAPGVDAAAAALTDALDDGERGADLLLYRALQEALSGIARAARATRVSVQLSRSAGRLSLCIEDDAGGECACTLAALRERVRHGGGALHAESLPGGGTRLAIAVSTAHGVAHGLG